MHIGHPKRIQGPLGDKVPSSKRHNRLLQSNLKESLIKHIHTHFRGCISSVINRLDIGTTRPVAVRSGGIIVKSNGFNHRDNDTAPSGIAAEAVGGKSVRRGL
jgi:hypothetical protein